MPAVTVPTQWHPDPHNPAVSWAISPATGRLLNRKAGESACYATTHCQHTPERMALWAAMGARIAEHSRIRGDRPGERTVRAMAEGYRAQIREG